MIQHGFKSSENDSIWQAFGKGNNSLNFHQDITRKQLMGSLHQ